MPLEIEAPEAVRLAEELSRRTGKSTDDVIERALRELFERTQGNEAEAERNSEIYALVHELRARIKRSAEPIQDPGEFLYGDDGLPK
jgi:hypothetical protein